MKRENCMIKCDWKTKDNVIVESAFSMLGTSFSEF